MNDAPRYSSLRDYLRVLRARRLLILLTALVFAGAAYGVSKTQAETYTAETSMSFRDASADSDLVGTTGVPRETPEQRAAVNAELVTRPAVAVRAKARLRTPLTAEQLRDRVTARPEARTNLVVITATADDGPEAAAIANAFAESAAALATENERRRFANAAATLRRNFRDARDPRRPGDTVTRGLFEQRIAQLDSLADFARPVSIGESADVPDTPSAPRPKRNAVLGLLLGLTLGIVAAFLREALDSRLKGAKEIEERLGLPVLAHVGKDALGGAALATNGNNAITPEDLESFRMLRTGIDFLDIDNETRSVLVTSGLPEEGKSTVAAALAAVTALSGKRVLLVETDLHRPSLAGRLGLEQEPGLSDYLTGKATPEEVLQQVQPAGVEGVSDGKKSKVPSIEADAISGLVCITAGSRVPRPAELLDSERFRTFLGEVAEAYDLVVLDSSPVLSVSDGRRLVPLVDTVLMCVRAWQTTGEEADAAKATIEQFPARSIGLVITGVRPSDAGSYGYYSYGDYSYPAA